MDVYGTVNLVRNPTCRKGNKGSILDVILTNVPKRCHNVTNWDIGLSDFHYIVCFALQRKCMYHGDQIMLSNIEAIQNSTQKVLNMNYLVHHLLSRLCLTI